MDSWEVQLNPDNRTEGFCFHLAGCPIAKRAKARGYDQELKQQHLGRRKSPRLLLFTFLSKIIALWRDATPPERG